MLNFVSRGSGQVPGGRGVGWGGSSLRPRAGWKQELKLLGPPTPGARGAGLWGSLPEKDPGPRQPLGVPRLCSVMGGAEPPQSRSGGRNSPSSPKLDEVGGVGGWTAQVTAGRGGQLASATSMPALQGPLWNPAQRSLEPRCPGWAWAPELRHQVSGEASLPPALAAAPGQGVRLGRCPWVGWPHCALCPPWAPGTAALGAAFAPFWGGFRGDTAQGLWKSVSIPISDLNLFHQTESWITAQILWILCFRPL